VTKLVDELIEKKKRNQKYFDDYIAYALKIKEIIKQSLGNVRVLVFGSVAKGIWTPNKSDIDILIISDKVSMSASWQNEMKLKILREIGDLSAPFEFHFATPEVYESWYCKFIGEDYVEIK
jgi:uncharacterized protein